MCRAPPAAGMGAMITIDALTTVRGGRTILSDVTCTASPGRVTALLGPNGAGKSSTLRILLGLDRPTGGTATIAGRRYADLPDPAREVGAMLDGPGAHRSRTARAHLSWIAAAGGIPQRRVAEVLAQVGLSDAAGRRCGRLSLGMGRRLGLAAALLGEPPVLVLDEPESGLDPEGKVWLRGLLRRHADDGGTVLLSSHSMTEVAELADDMVVISGGRVAAAGTSAQVTAGHPSLEAAFLTLTDGGGHRPATSGLREGEVAR